MRLSQLFDEGSPGAERKPCFHQRFRFLLPKIRNESSNQLVATICDFQSAIRPQQGYLSRMRLKAAQLSVVVVVATALAGCQSGPRWAWWKHDAAPDASATARTAEPVLPSSQAKP